MRDSCKKNASSTMVWITGTHMAQAAQRYSILGQKNGIMFLGDPGRKLIEMTESGWVVDHFLQRLNHSSPADG